MSLSEPNSFVRFEDYSKHSGSTIQRRQAYKNTPVNFLRHGFPASADTRKKAYKPLNDILRLDCSHTYFTLHRIVDGSANSQ